MMFIIKFLIVTICLIQICVRSTLNDEIFNSVISTNQLPFEMPSFDQVLNSNKFVLAHYFKPFPLSIDNKNPSQDYYSVNYLQPSGEGNKFIKQGGFLRVRPLPIFAPQNASNIYWKLTNMEKEVRMAIARGINGWSYDILSVKDIGNGTCFYKGTLCELSIMLQAVKNVDSQSRFKVVLMPDMSSSLSLSDIVTIVKYLYNDTAIYRNGSKPVIAPFYAEGVSPIQWQSLLQNLTSDGFPILLLPTFLTISSKYINVEMYANISIGMGVWATVGVPTQGSSSIAYASTVRNAKSNNSLLFWLGMMPQTYKPKDCILYDSYNSLAYRNAWMSTLQTNADIVHVATWNDFSESGQLQPITDLQNTTGNGFYDLTAYYAHWWRTGLQPTIIRDVVYYFYRKEATNAYAPNMGCNFTMGISQSVSNQIEVLTFTTDQSILTIMIENSNYTFMINSSGINSFFIPLQAGKPNIQLWRNGINIITVEGNHEIYATNVGLPNGVLDLTYWSGSTASFITPSKSVNTFTSSNRNVSSSIVAISKCSTHVNMFIPLFFVFIAILLIF